MTLSSSSFRKHINTRLLLPVPSFFFFFSFASLQKKANQSIPCLTYPFSKPLAFQSTKPPKKLTKQSTNNKQPTNQKKKTHTMCFCITNQYSCGHFNEKILDCQKPVKECIGLVDHFNQNRYPCPACTRGSGGGRWMNECLWGWRACFCGGV